MQSHIYGFAGESTGVGCHIASQKCSKTHLLQADDYKVVTPAAEFNGLEEYKCIPGFI